MNKAGWVASVGLAAALFASSSFSTVLTFDDIDTAAGDVVIDSLSPYQGFTWTNFSAYLSIPGFTGFNNGIVSAGNATYGGAEDADGTPLTSRLAATSAFDFNSAYVGAGYYDTLTVTFEGRRNGALTFTKTVVADTNGASNFVFNFTGIDALDIFSAATAASSDPFACGTANCSFFTLDNLVVVNSDNPPPPPPPPVDAPPTMALLAFGLLALRYRLKRVRAFSPVVAAFVAMMGLTVLLTSPTTNAEDVPVTMRVVPGLEEPLIAAQATSAQEDAALAAAVDAFRHPDPLPGDFADLAKPFTTFPKTYPHSPWRVSILINLGLGYYRAGYFTTATTMWERAWDAGRAATAPQAKALADRAIGELARMHARVGHEDALEKLFADMGDRQVSGGATEMITGTHEALWMFRNEPGKSFLCGSMALKNLLIALKADSDKIAALDHARSGKHGFSLQQVAQMATDAKLPHRLIYRTTDEAIPVPSIVNWKLHHYAAIVGEEDGRYHIQDPTFASGDLWMTKAAIDAEASGYFLVPTGKETTIAWRDASADEAQQVYGMGFTSQNQPGSTTPNDKDKNSSDPSNLSCPAGKGMCAANAKLMVVSLTLSDTPVGYQPPKGLSANIRLTYNQREASQPAIFTSFNVSPKWTLNLLSWVQDNPALPGRTVMRYVAGGGAITYSSPYTYSAITGAFSPERQGQAVLVRIPATGALTSYELRMPDGSKQVFAKPDGATVGVRRVFLTQMVDPAGNALTLNYDAQLRLTSLTDATGRNTTFSYGLAASPLLVTRITDPFGRHADLAYDASGRLASITDVIGITSLFTYDVGGLINALTTPYGTSRFAYGNTGTTRFLNMTDALGLTERIEFNHAAGIPSIDPVAPIGVANRFLNYRNTFYWDKHVYPITHTDYSKANLTHWLHNPSSQTSPIVESTKRPLENRVWNAYPGENFFTYFEGTADTPRMIARILDDGATQASFFTYNAIGKPLTAIDPLGRKTVFTYDASGVNLLTVQQQTAASGTLTTIASFTYNSQHLPLTATDAAGQVTRYSYNAAGQLTSVTDALNRTTRYGFDAIGRLLTVTDANNVIQQTLTYDGFDRVATRTDSEGHTTSYSYDALDRVTQIAYPDGTTTQYGYNKLDRVSMKDRQGRMTLYSYDANRRLIAVTDPLSRITRYGYYNNGVLKNIIDPKGNVTSWDIDIQSRVVAKHYFDGTKVTTTYENTTSRVKSVTDALNQSKQYAYATDNRLFSVVYANALNPTPKVSFTYDGFFPRVSSMTDGTGLTQYSYHPAGALGALQLAREDGAFANDDINYQYDALGRVINRNVAGSVESWAYDTIGRTTTHSSDLGAFNLGYLGETGQLTSRRSATVGTDWGYEGNFNDRRLKSIANSGVARDYQYTTTPENFISRIVESVNAATPKTWDFTYDPSDRLTKAQASSGALHGYGYDNADNLTSITSPAGSKAIAVNAVNQATSVNGVPFSYDANGNLTADDIRTYQWDAENRLVGIRYKANPAKETTFRYDGRDRRVAIVEKSGVATTETRYQWCGMSLCQARSAIDTVTRRYVDEGELRPVSGEKLYYATDHLGSVRDVLATSGSKVASYDYDPYGNTTLASGRGSADFRYAGMFQHQESGLYLTLYRAYDPKTARWLSRDPIEESGGLNLQGYVGGNPIKNIDPLGLGLCVYNNRTGEMTCFTTTPVGSSNGGGYFTGTFTSGNNNISGCMNNPDCERKSYVGPIPAGWWQWNQYGRSSKENGYVLDPIPDPFNPEFPYDRSGFQTHSCLNPGGPTAGRGDHPCSAGCVTGTVSTTQRLNNFLKKEWAAGQKNELLVYH